MNRQHIAWLATLSILVMSGCQTDEVTTMVGTLERDRVELKVESNEPIVEIAVSDGQAVEPGDLVLRQASTRAEARVAQVQAQRAQATARLAELQRGPREESIREARANLAAARADRVNASNRLQRTREVFARGLSSQGQLDADETSFQTSMAREQAASEALERLLNGTTVEELRQAEAAVQAVDAQLELAGVDLERTQVTAPVAGVVDKVLFQLGERPAPGTTVAVVLANSRAFARVYVPEEIRARLQPGDRIDVRVDGVDTAYEGRVRWVSADASFTPYFALTEHDRSRLSYLAEIDLEDAGDLPSGLPLEAERPRD